MMRELERNEEDAAKAEVYAYLLHSQDTQNSAAGRLLARVREVAATMLEANPDDIVLTDDTLRGQMERATPLGRIGDDEDLKGVTVLFASDAGKHITGQTLAVDGAGSV